MSPSSSDTTLQRSTLAVERAPARASEHRHGPGVLVTVRQRRWSSIERQLPVLILAILLPIVVALAFSVHADVTKSLTDAAIARMEGNGREVAGLFEAGLRPGPETVERAAQSAAMVACASSADPPLVDAATKVFDNWLRSPRGTLIELWSADGQRRFQVKSRVAPGAPVPVLHTIDWPPPTQDNQEPLLIVDGKPVQQIVTDVRADANSPIVGHLVLRRHFSGGQGAQMLQRLVGTNCTMMLGNPDGSAWTDTERQVPAPAVNPLDPMQRVFRNVQGVLRVGAGFGLKTVPLVLWVEGDLGDALAPADHLLVFMLVVGSGLLLVGGFAAWAISRRITRPLREVTEAAEAIAAGDYGQRLVLRRHDEVGRLTQAFNVMAAEVEDARDQQDALVARRTADLQQAMLQLRDAQDDLVRKEKLALMGQLAGSVGHELRNPLGVMTNAIYYLDMVLDQASPEVRDYLGILRRQVSLSEKIITDLLDFTRHRPPNAAPIDLAHVVHEQLERLGPLRVQVDNRTRPGLPRAFADGVQVGQIVFNLLTNAVQAMEQQPDGKLVIEADAQDGRIRLEVRDTGPGVSAELRERIFEPLFTTRARGIGLGLSVSRRLAEGNGGSLSLAETNGRGGATFVLELPTGESGSS